MSSRFRMAEVVVIGGGEQARSVLVEDGKVKEVEAEAVIIGGMVLDIHATPSVPANPRTTTPGKVCV
ncbi:hypothetical protein C3L33_19538, partial [Rhododendron williamsianum]